MRLSAPGLPSAAAVACALPLPATSFLPLTFSQSSTLLIRNARSPEPRSHCARLSCLVRDSSCGRVSPLSLPVGTPLPFGKTRPRCRKTCRGSKSTVAASWKQEISWEDVEVADVSRDAQMLYSVTLNINPNPILQSGYTIPGQYVQVRVGESKPAFLAIASPPSAARGGVMEFLVKAVEGSTAELVTRVQPGQQVQVSQVLGKGFNVPALSTPEDVPVVLLLATGSGISPIRALIEEGIEAASRKEVRLFLGSRTQDYLPYKEKFALWEDAGVTVVPVLSQPPEGYAGESGYVQDALERTEAELDGALAGAVLCGHKAMAEAATNFLKVRGVPENRILMNF